MRPPAPRVSSLLGAAMIAATLAGVGAAACSGAGQQSRDDVVVDPIAPSDEPTRASFVGTWRTNWGQVEIIQSSGKVMGSFSYLWEGKERIGILIGEQKGNQLPFHWSEEKGADKGRGRFVIAPDGGRFSGTYGYEESETDAGPWNGIRIKDTLL